MPPPAPLASSALAVDEPDPLDIARLVINQVLVTLKGVYPPTYKFYNARVCCIEVAITPSEADGQLMSQRLWFHKPVQCDYITTEQQLQVVPSCVRALCPSRP